MILGIEHTSASSISLRPKAARERSATLNLVAGAPDMIAVMYEGGGLRFRGGFVGEKKEEEDEGGTFLDKGFSC